MTSARKSGSASGHPPPAAPLSDPSPAEVSLPPEPRWPALVAILTAGLVYAALPTHLSIGPRWLLVVLITLLEIPTMIAHYRGMRRINRVLGFIASGVLTGFVAWSLGRLVVTLPAHKEAPVAMLRSAGSLWIANVITFALWYWRLDAGGPYSRSRGSHSLETAAFLFPQLTLKKPPPWRPHLIDYLFLAFNTSTALSPTDTPILNRWAKLLTMLQSLISLLIVALLLARAVNVL